MIEKCYGQAIYGIDVFTKGLDESNTTLWLQKESSGEILPLDEFASIDFGLPKATQKVNTVGGLAGGFFEGKPTYQNRTFSFSTFFAGTNEKKALNSERIQKIIKWFVYNQEDKMWLYWNVKDWSKTYRIEVRPSIASETYKKYCIADGVKVTLTAEKPYFEALEDTVLEYNVDTQSFVIEINNTGIELPFILEFNPTSDCSFLSVYNDKGYGFKIEAQLIQGYYQYRFDGINSICYENNIETPNFITTGSMFTLKPGLNKIHISCDSTSTSEIKIRARERVL